MTRDILLMLTLALVIDLALGELPRLIHPVVGMGKVIAFLAARNAGTHHSTQLFYGVGIVLVTLGLFTVSTYFILFYLKSLSMVVYLAVGAVFLKSSFSLKELQRAARKVKTLLIKKETNEACVELRSLVGRNTQDLPQSLLVSATVESVAENTCDSFVAPLFYFLIFGVPGAIAYRVANTLDAMIGYHGQYEYLGKFAAKLDDVLNLIPARISALLLVLATGLCRRDTRNSWRTAFNHHSRTESPNAGWSMSAMAGALNVQLEKRGYYQLGEASAPLVPQTIDASLELAQTATIVWATLCLMVGVIRLVYFA